MNQAPELVGVAEAAAALGVRQPVVRAWVREGRLRAVRIGRTGRCMRIVTRSIRELLDGNAACREVRAS
ncbi:MAG: helix-turn-helix domain-containing protein [Planctomycetes bacterium]|nr:helix-turn-helix domain-containing protein [Planctomycetota bacterium]